MDLIYFLKVLYRKKWIICGLAFISVIIAFVFLLNKKPLYESTAQYSTGFTAERVRISGSTSDIDLYTADVKFNNVIETIKSPQVIGMISYRLLLHDISDPQNAYRRLTIKNTETQIYKDVNLDYAKVILAQKIADDEMLSSDIDKERQLIEYLKLYAYDYDGILKYLSIERVEETDYLDITFGSEDKRLSAFVVNAIGEEFLNYYKNLNSQRTEENAQSFKLMADSLQRQVDSIGELLVREKMSQGSLDPVSRTTSAMETIKDLQTKVEEEKGKYNEHFNKLEYLNTELQTLQSGITQSGSSNDEVLQLKNRENELVAELAQKGGTDPVLQQQISDLRTQIILKSSSGISRTKTTENIADIKNQINEEQASENASSTTIEDYNSKIREYQSMTNINPGSNIRLDALKAELDIENKQLANARDKYSQAEGLVKDDPTSNFIQTRVGQQAVEPKSKKTMVIMALTGISMLFMVSVFFIFLEIFDPSVKTPSIFSKLTKMKVIGVLNRIKLKKEYVTDIIMQDQEGDKFLIQNIFKNNIRKLRYELLNSGKNIFLFASTRRGAGKSTIIEALATSLLLNKKKVLIIDLNFSHNSLTKKYNAGVLIQDIGAIINYSLPLESQQLWASTMYDGIKVIGCNAVNTTPSEALYNIDLHAFLQGLKKHFDIILIEAAALNNYADTKELTQYAEAIFTVYSAASSVSNVDIDSFQFIKSLGEKNNNVVLNSVLTENINF